MQSLGTKKVPDGNNLRIKIFADGANIETMLHYYKDPRIAGFTTNPTLMRKAGISDYESFAREVLVVIKDRPISFEVFSDDFTEMEKQAHTIAAWGNNTNVKIPITNTKGEPSTELIKRLSKAGIKMNVTAITLFEQVAEVASYSRSRSRWNCFCFCRQNCRCRTRSFTCHEKVR